MDLRKLKKLIDLVEESGISELELTEGEESVRISRQGQVVQQPQQYAIPQQPTPAVQNQAPTPTASADNEVVAQETVHAREEFRHKSYFSDKAKAVICGLGKDGYSAAIQHIVKNS